MSSMFAHSEPGPGTHGQLPMPAGRTWRAEVDAARGPDDEAFERAFAARQASQAAEVEFGSDGYRVRFEVVAEDLAEATRIALGHWWHVLEVAHLPEWEPASLVVELEPDHRSREPVREPPRLAS
jgi:hypothetical protein